MPDVPSKKPLGYPVPLEGLAIFAHPDPEHIFARVALLPSHAVGVCNGWLKLEADKFQVGDVEPASPEFLARWDQRDRRGWGPRTLWDDTQPWRALDDVAGTLWRFGARPAWEKTRTRWHPRLTPAIRIGPAGIVPLAMLQLAARLPRAQVLTDTLRDAPVRVRFNGGRLMLHNHATSLAGQEAVAIFQSPRDPLPR